MMSERVLTDIAAATGMRYAILRYFNVAGADPQVRIGEATPDNAHLIKLACETAAGLRPAMAIHGTDYPTADGTCIRDYVHVDDLARAHLAALEHLAGGGASLVANCGYGHGFSVREVLETARRVTGVAFRIDEGPRRPGDPAALVADSRKLQTLLGWRPLHDDLDYILATAWRWERRLQAGLDRPAAH
jgi:UDP-glucose 4-epimerase